jgi:nicotinic acid mononucleotide adenylyltransferase
VFEAMTEEITFIMGADGYAYLNEYYQKQYKHKKRFS